MDALTTERMGPDQTHEPGKQPVNRWGDTAEDIKARQSALDRHWRERKAWRVAE